jgi:RloB-like protein
MTSKSGRPRENRQRGRGFRRETSLLRAADTREERWSVVIVTNGKRTEFDYFYGLKNSNEDWTTDRKITPKFVPGDPVSAVRRAAAIRADNEYDLAWVVCDVDEYDVKAALTEVAKYDRVELALSRPSFEVWLILHLNRGCPGFNNAPQAGVHLGKLLPGWDKTALRFADFSASVLDAAKRAKALGEPPEANPSTAVWRVIESIRLARDRPEAG